MALACLAVMTCAIAAGQEGSTYVDPAIEEVKEQVIKEKTTSTNSFKGEPWATSSLNDSYKKTTSVGSISVVPVSSALGQSSEYMVKTDSFLKQASNNGFYVLSVAEFINKTIAEKNWAVVDVSPAQLYAAGHIPGAINIPLADLISQMGMIPAGQRVAVYSAIDTDAAFAVETLRVFGDRDAFVLSGGVVSWQAAGKPVETL
ncbi:MAG: rhodanese-like domain-containing protein [Methanothrix sp.]|nr:rhodanese-like domain-containing protein [Methanothrix sp.]